MFRCHKNTYRRIAKVALIGLVLRSLVAPGLMVVDGADGSGGLSLVLCPGQNPGLNFALLTGGADHHNHHHGSAPQDPTELDAAVNQDIGVHAESLDAACALWVASASSAALAAYTPSISEFAKSEQSIPHAVAHVRSTLRRSRQSRAPPIIT